MGRCLLDSHLSGRVADKRGDGAVGHTDKAIIYSSVTAVASNLIWLFIKINTKFETWLTITKLFLADKHVTRLEKSMNTGLLPPPPPPLHEKL